MADMFDTDNVNVAVIATAFQLSAKAADTQSRLRLFLAMYKAISEAVNLATNFRQDEIDVDKLMTQLLEEMKAK